MDWVTCEVCDETFKVITDGLKTIEYCPYCGSDIEALEIEEDEEDWDSEDKTYFS
jgi:rRNA maturation endonuclease Nob1